MFKSIAIIALGVVATVVDAQGFTVNTPAALVQCQPSQLSWSGGQPPYIVDIIPGKQTTAAPLLNVVNSIQGTSTTWTVNLAAGTDVTIKVTDSAGNIQYSSDRTIIAGSSTSCLNSTATSAAGAAGVTGSASGSAASGSSSGSAASGSMSSAAGSSSAASTSKAASSMASSMASKSASGSASATSANAGSSSSAAKTSGAALKNLEAPGLILAFLGGLAALL